MCGSVVGRAKRGQAGKRQAPSFQSDKFYQFRTRDKQRNPKKTHTTHHTLEGKTKPSFFSGSFVPLNKSRHEFKKCFRAAHAPVPIHAVNSTEGGCVVHPSTNTRGCVPWAAARRRSVSGAQSAPSEQWRKILLRLRSCVGILF